MWRTLLYCTYFKFSRELVIEIVKKTFEMHDTVPLVDRRAVDSQNW